MDPSIRPIGNPPTRPAAPVRRRSGDEPAFQLPTDEPEEEESEDEPVRPEHTEDRPVAPRPDDEAGSHLDVTA